MPSSRLGLEAALERLAPARSLPLPWLMILVVVVAEVVLEARCAAPPLQARAADLAAAAPRRGQHRHRSGVLATLAPVPAKLAEAVHMKQGRCPSLVSLLGAEVVLGWRQQGPPMVVLTARVPL